MKKSTTNQLMKAAQDAAFNNFFTNLQGPKPFCHSTRSSGVRLHSMRQNYSHDLLLQFYNEQMIPNFPIKEERDSLDDWIFCLDPRQVEMYDENAKRGPVMDILLLLSDVDIVSNSSEERHIDTCDSKEKDVFIVAGVAFEYYQQAEIGLVSYITVHEDFKRRGIMKALHPLAIQALKELHNKTYKERFGSLPDNGIKAIFAETNTIQAGDASIEDIMNRHRALFALGYRLVEYPYSQPPLERDGESFDDLMLLVYQGTKTDNGSGLWFDGDQIPTTFPHTFIVDFFMSVFGYTDTHGNSEQNYNADIMSFDHHRVYKLSKWFSHKNSYAKIKKDLPWEDLKSEYQLGYDNADCDIGERVTKEEATVIVIGAGAAGLSAALHLAKNTTSPLLVRLIEANDFVGGRIRTVITTDELCDDQYVKKDLADRCKKFQPWPVPIGAEFIHGVGSVVNDLVEDNCWEVEETFDLCGLDEYPSKNSFVTRCSTSSLTINQRKLGVKLFGDGKCWDLGQSHTDTGDSYGMLIHKAQKIWDEIYSLGEDINIDSIPLDMSLSSLIEQRTEDFVSKRDIDMVKSILDAIYVKTAGSSLDSFGINEASREELNWSYTESNFRLKQCFAEIINHYLEEIKSVNAAYQNGQSRGRIEVITSTPIVNVGSTSNDNVENSKIILSCKDGKDFICDKVIVTVPLGVLKAGQIHFGGNYSLPAEKKLAIQKINFFSGMKAHILLRRGTDVENVPLLENTELFFCPGEKFVQVWVRRDKRSIFLTGFIVADGRDALLSEILNNDKTAEEIFLSQLLKMIGRDAFIHSQATCTAFELHDWSEDEYCMGMYSSPSVNAGWKYNKDTGLKTLRDDIRAPIRGKIYFAGEHANLKNCATVQAAIESGLDTASDILASFAGSAAST